jgi:zinc transport system substrate-binding protein
MVTIKKTRQSAIYVFLFLLIFSGGCTRQKTPEAAGKLKIVTTLFPLYDFARNIGKESVDVQLLLPPGVEPHNFEPKPEDIVRTGKADLFVFTSVDMEPWADTLFKAVSGNGKVVMVEAGERASYISRAAEHLDDRHRHGSDNDGGRDPHIWLDLDNAMGMVDVMTEAMSRRAPNLRPEFNANAAAYKKRLAELDGRFKQGLSTCRTRSFLHGGHYAFAYLARRYGLDYLSAYGSTADSEPTPRRMMELVQNIRKNQLKYVFSEELLSPRVAETIARETGAQVLKLHGGHNISREDMEGGISFVNLMEQNLLNLQKGLECR